MLRQEGKQRFTLRKNKRYKNLVSVGLGLFIVTGAGLIAGNEAHASEAEQPQVIRTENPATNSVAAQPKSTNEATASIEKTGEKAGVVDVKIDNTAVDTAVNNAKASGIKVEKEADKNLGTAKSTEEAKQKLAEVNKDYEKQAIAINVKAEEYMQEVAEHKAEVSKIQAENKALQDEYLAKKESNKIEVARIEKENADKKAEYEEKLAKQQQESKTITSSNEQATAEYNKNLETYKTEKARIEAENAKLKADYDKKIEKYNIEKVAYEKIKSDIDSKINSLKNKEPLVEEKNGVSIYGKLNEEKRGTLGYYDYTLVNDKNISGADTVNGKLKWNNNTTVEFLSGKGSLTEDNTLRREIDPNTNRTFTYLLKDFGKGTKFKINNVGTTEASKKNINLIFELLEDNKKLYNHPTYNPWISINQGISDDSIMFVYSNAAYVNTRVYFVDDEGNPLKLAMTNIVTDVDHGQGSNLKYSEYNFKNVIAKDSGIVADKSLGEYFVKAEDLNMSAASDNSDTPLGTYFASGVGEYIDYKHIMGQQLIPDFDMSVYSKMFDGQPWGVQFNLFGSGGTIIEYTTPYQPAKPEEPKYKDIPPVPTEPKLKEIPERPTPPTYKEIPPAPLEPKLKEEPKAPEVPTIKYHYVNYNVEPNILKEVKNVEGTDINKNLVSKLSTVNWELKTEDLPANRDKIKSYVITDNLPTGFEINLEDTKKLSKGFLVEFDKVTNTAVFTADENTIMLLNKDLTKEVKPIYPVASGTVVNDGATYENNFKLEVNNYKVFSNKVVVYTPGNDPKKPRPPFSNTPGEPEDPTPNDNLIKPIKHNENKDGVVIDGKTLLPNTINNYKLLWDLDQYKGIKASKEDIAKGFFYIEDYPEEALELNSKDVTLLDSKGQEVTGVKVEAFESVEKATDVVKTMLEKAKITPKGAFQLFTAENTEEFFSNYVVVGNSIMITSPMTIKEGFNGKYENKAYQVDFGNGYETDIIKNDVIKPEPKKHNENKAGVVIDGKTLLPNSINYYKLTWDLDQYANLEVSKEDIAKGFYFVEDYPEEALELDFKNVVLLDSKGKTVKGVKVEAFDNLDKATDVVKTMLEKAKITPKGAFQLFSAENPEEFFSNYVAVGNSIMITSPMTVIEAFNGEYENKAYQIDFGFGYETELVVNNVPKLDPRKDVVVDVTNSNNSLDGKELSIGQVFNYHLVGAKLPSNRADEITQYGFSDDYDQKGDQYDGVYTVFATTDITLKDKSVIKKGTDVTKYTTQVLDTENGKVDIEVDKDFLSKVSTDIEFQLDVYLQMKRIASGEFTNTFVNTINGYKVNSNTVKTNTPEPVKPQPKPELKEPTPPQKTLPKTSAAKNTDESNGLGAVAGTVALLGTLTLVRRRKVDNKITE